MERPDEQRSGDEEVEERVDRKRGDERRVPRAGDALLDEVELEYVAPPRGHERVHGCSCGVRTEHAAPAHHDARMSGGENISPGTRSNDHLAEVEGRGGREPAPADRSKMVDEDVHGVEDLAQQTRPDTVIPIRSSACASSAPSTPPPYACSEV